jgi:serine protease inhibitor
MRVRRNTLVHGLATMGLVGVASCTTSPSTPAACSAPQAGLASAQKLAAANTEFSLAMYPRTVTANGSSENLIVSPYSASADLTMLQAGAAGQTASQIQSALDLPESATHLAPAYAALACGDETDGSSSGNQLTLSNAVWVDQGMTLESSFVSLLTSGFAAPPQQVNFADPSGAASAIDTWVSNATDGEIPQLFQASDLSASTRLVLVNAVYFKGSWANAFDPSQTSPAPFTLEGGDRVQVPTMNDSMMPASASLTSSLTALELSYMGNRLVMDFLMPHGSLVDFESSMTPEKLESTINGLEAGQFNVSLPKFSFKSRLDLIPILKGLGMQDVFNAGSANLSGIDGRMDLYVSLVVQQAMVEVDEQGTVAAAATGTDVETSAVAFAPVVNLDHPFLFLIRDTNTGSVLFMGRVMDPSQSS